ncbi:MAG: 4Fe-4S binding protein, partial [Proteobacteria bacterium]|nr:4Fe-4S binding protein [Pseudomonadota bacterium]
SQFDTGHTYAQCGRAALAAARFFEDRGHPAVAVPAFIPLDMAAPKKGMRGEICWRRAGVRAGLGSYGDNGLLITPEFGAAVRLSGMVTTAELEPGRPLGEDVCDHCGQCLEACPAQALSGEGKINKKKCGDHIFQFGFRYFQDFIRGLMDRPTEDVREVVEGHGLRELWQNFMTGNYYYCWDCQTQCPAAKMPDRETA